MNNKMQHRKHQFSATTLNYVKDVVLLENTKSQKDDVMLTITVDREAKEAAERVCKELGLTLNDAINLFLKQVIIQRSITFPITLDRYEKQ